jgi:predicted membrane-bound dolichyl-phosphate-mannose-protein mannosyltransferase
MIACVVSATRGLSMLNNLLGYFTGLITFFAAHQEPAPATIGALAVAIAIGSAAGIASQRLQPAITG